MYRLLDLCEPTRVLVSQFCGPYTCGMLDSSGSSSTCPFSCAGCLGISLIFAVRHCNCSRQLLDEISLVSLMMTILGSGPSTSCMKDKLWVSSSVLGFVSESLHQRPCLFIKDGKFCVLHYVEFSLLLPQYVPLSFHYIRFPHHLQKTPKFQSSLPVLYPFTSHLIPSVLTRRSTHSTTETSFTSPFQRGLESLLSPLSFFDFLICGLQNDYTLQLISTYKLLHIMFIFLSLHYFTQDDFFQIHPFVRKFHVVSFFLLKAK